MTEASKKFVGEHDRRAAEHGQPRGEVPVTNKERGAIMRAAVEGHVKGKPELVVVSSKNRPLTKLEAAQQGAAIQTAKTAIAQRQHLEAEEADAQSAESKERVGTLEYNRRRAGGLLVSKAAEESKLSKQEAKIALTKRKEAVRSAHKSHPSKFAQSLNKLAQTSEPEARLQLAKQVTAAMPAAHRRALLTELAELDSSDLNDLIDFNSASDYRPFGAVSDSKGADAAFQRKVELQALALTDLERRRFEQNEGKRAALFERAAQLRGDLLDRRLKGRIGQ
jgi:hypothetical protein